MRGYIRFTGLRYYSRWVDNQFSDGRQVSRPTRRAVAFSNSLPVLYKRKYQMNNFDSYNAILQCQLRLLQFAECPPEMFQPISAERRWLVENLGLDVRYHLLSDTVTITVKRVSFQEGNTFLNILNQIPCSQTQWFYRLL